MNRSLHIVGALALSFSFAQVAVAQPPAGGVVRQACMADAQKLCPDAKPGPGGGLRACMKDHYASLSDACKSAIAQMRAQHQHQPPPPPTGQ